MTALIGFDLRNREQLWLGLHHAVLDGMTLTWELASPKGPQEPDLVAGLVVFSRRSIERAMQHALAPLRVNASVVSVFCHQRPMVTYSGIENQQGQSKKRAESCELGDVLFVHIHRGGGRLTRNALLLQAKMAKPKRNKVAVSDGHQLHLYTDWPEYTYRTVLAHGLLPPRREVTTCRRRSQSCSTGPQVGVLALGNRPASEPAGPQWCGTLSSRLLGTCLTAPTWASPVSREP
jgi:hypothetical protein